jgi:hypothetical protein
MAEAADAAISAAAARIFTIGLFIFSVIDYFIVENLNSVVE